MNQRQRYRPVTLPQDFSDEEMARGWTLSPDDRLAIQKFHKNFRLFVAAQLCAVRLYGRFLSKVVNLSPRIVSYLSKQLDLPPALSVVVPDREATVSEQRKRILAHLRFTKFSNKAQSNLESWLESKAKQGHLPDELYSRSEQFLLANRVILPGPTVLERLIVRVCADVHEQIFETLYVSLSPELKNSLEDLLTVSPGDQRSSFFRLKEYPPSATVTSIQQYLDRYDTLVDAGIDRVDSQGMDPAFLDYLYRLTRRYSAKDMKRFKAHKRCALMVCFLLETRRVLLDHLIKMHDQYLMDLLRKCKRIHEDRHRVLRKRQKKAVDTVLTATL